MKVSLESKGSCPKGTAKRLAMQMWLRYDEPSLRESGNNALFNKEIAIYTADKLWDILKAKKHFPQGQPELAAKKLPSNDFIGYVLKVDTVFRRTIGNTVMVFLSDLSKQEVLDKLRAIN